MCVYDGTTPSSTAVGGECKGNACCDGNTSWSIHGEQCVFIPNDTVQCTPPKYYSTAEKKCVDPAPAEPEVQIGALPQVAPFSSSSSLGSIMGFTATAATTSGVATLDPARKRTTRPAVTMPKRPRGVAAAAKAVSSIRGVGQQQEHGAPLSAALRLRNTRKTWFEADRRAVS